MIPSLNSVVGGVSAWRWQVMVAELGMVWDSVYRWKESWTEHHSKHQESISRPWSIMKKEKSGGRLKQPSFEAQLCH